MKAELLSNKDDLLSKLGFESHDACLRRIKNLENDEQSLNNIKNIIKLKTNELVDEKVKKIVSASEESKKFFVRIISALSSQINPSKIMFPIPEDKQQSIVASIKMIITTM